MIRCSYGIPAPAALQAGKHYRRTSGFSLVELLVVIAIIGALASLLLPAIQSTREAARRAQCASNLKQIALAALQHSESRGMLPAAGEFAPPEEAVWFDQLQLYHRIELRSGKNYSWIVMILPYLEQQDLYQQFVNAPHVVRVPPAALRTHLDVLQCASDGGQDRLFQRIADDFAGEAIFAKGNYAGYTSPYHVDDVDFHGALGHYGRELREVSDGLSNAFAFSEVRTRDHPRDQRGAWALPWSGATLLSFDMHPRAVGDEEGDVPGYAYRKLSFGQTQLPNSHHPDVLYDCPDPTGELIDRMPCLIKKKGSYSYISAAPRSMHPGGVNGAFLDGSVRFIGDDADEVMLAYQVAINDGRLLTERDHETN